LTDTFNREIDPEGWTLFGQQELPADLPRWADREVYYTDVMDFFNQHLAPYRPTMNQIRKHDFSLYGQLRSRFTPDELMPIAPTDSFINQQLVSGFEARYGKELALRLKRGFTVRSEQERRKGSAADPSPD